MSCLSVCLCARLWEVYVYASVSVITFLKRVWEVRSKVKFSIEIEGMATDLYSTAPQGYSSGHLDLSGLELQVKFTELRQEKRVE